MKVAQMFIIRLSWGLNLKPCGLISYHSPSTPSYLFFKALYNFTVVSAPGEVNSGGGLVDCCKNATSSRFCFKYESISHQKVCKPCINTCGSRGPSQGWRLHGGGGEECFLVWNFAWSNFSSLKLHWHLIRLQNYFLILFGSEKICWVFIMLDLHGTITQMSK